MFVLLHQFPDTLEHAVLRHVHRLAAYPVGGSMPEILSHIIQTVPTSATQSWSAQTGISTAEHAKAACPIDDEVETIVMKCLAKERERRYQSAGELARDLRHYLAGEPIEAKRDSAWYVVSKQLRRHRFATVVAAVFVIVLAASTWVMWKQAREFRALAISEASAKAGALAARDAVDSQRRRAEAAEAVALAEAARAEQTAMPSARSGSASTGAGSTPAPRMARWASLRQPPGPRSGRSSPAAARSSAGVSATTGTCSPPAAPTARCESGT